MKIKIIDVYETQSRIVVEVEHEYGKETIGLSLEAKYLGNDGQPKWKKEVRDLLRMKYGNLNKDKSIPVKREFNNHIGKKIDI